MKKSITMLLILTLVISLCACGGSERGAAGEQSTEDEEWIEVDQDLLTVEITIPADLAEGMTQDEVDANVKEMGLISGKLNDDGSITYKMTKGRHRELLAEMRTSIDEALDDLVGSGEYGFTKIEADKDYTKFTVTTSSTQITMMESLSLLAFYTYGGMYNAFSGEPVDNISVDFVNEATGQSIGTANSRDLAQ